MGAAAHRTGDSLLLGVAGQGRSSGWRVPWSSFQLSVGTLAGEAAMVSEAEAGLLVAPGHQPPDDFADGKADRQQHGADGGREPDPDRPRRRGGLTLSILVDISSSFRALLGLLLCDDSVVLELELVAFAGRLSCVPGDLEREFDGELDPVRLPGMASDRLHEGVVVVGPDLVAAVAAECLASEHVAADTPAVQLEAC